MATDRARRELGWRPYSTGPQAVGELLEGLRAGAGHDTPPLAPRVPGGRWHEVATGVGGRP